MLVPIIVPIIRPLGITAIIGRIATGEQRRCTGVGASAVKEKAPPGRAERGLAQPRGGPRREPGIKAGGHRCSLVMQLLVYVDYANRWATIHRPECRRSRGHVEGTNKARSAKRPLWLGPFDTADAATEAASKTGLRLVIDGCKLCRPDLGMNPTAKESLAVGDPPVLRG